jgi:hypothetical protein
LISFYDPLHLTKIEDYIKEDIIIGYATELLLEANKNFSLHGTINMGADLARVAWPKLRQEFSCSARDSSQDLPGWPATLELGAALVKKESLFGAKLGLFSPPR